MASILALDQGTTGSTALLDPPGRHACWAAATASSPSTFRGPAGSSTTPRRSCGSRWRRCARRWPGRASGRSGIGITNQRETVVLWDRRTLAPVAPAIVWQDRRTSERCRELRETGVETLLRERTGLVADPYFSATKLEWLLRDAGLAAARGARRAGRRHGRELARGQAHRRPSPRHRPHQRLAHAALRPARRATGTPSCSRLFGVPRELLPGIVHVRGRRRRDGPGAPRRGLPIAGLAGDQQAALFGQGCCRDGLAKNTYGTGAFLLVYTGRAGSPSRARACWRPPPAVRAGEPAYALEGSVFIAGAAVQWLRDGLGLIRSAAETEALARSVPDTGGVHFVPAFVGLGTPHWEPRRGERSPVSPAARLARTWSARRSRRWRTAARSCSRR